MLRKLVRWLLRVLITAAVIFVIVLISDYLSHRVEPGTVLVVKLTGNVVERSSASAVSLVSGANETPLNSMRRALHMAARDERIVGVALKVIDPQMEFAQAQEIGTMVRQFGASGKWTSAYLETAGEGAPGNLDYLAASSAQEVSLMPRGELNLVGIQMREIFLRGLLDWLAIRPEVDAIGAYKSLRNQLTEKGFTPEHREEDESLVEDLYQQLIRGVAQNRKLDPDKVKSLIDSAPLTPQAGKDAHLVDRLEYEDEFTERNKNRDAGKHALLDYQSYASPRIIGRPSAKDQIAVVYGSGGIQRGEGGFDPLFSPGGSAMGSEEMREAFKSARDDSRIKAVVFRIDSPGGSVIASELIRREAQLTATKKPLVVSMSSYAASGGYWVSTPARKIFADPGTITGSIGVVMAKFDFSGLANKFGVTSDAVSRGENVTIYDEFAQLTPEQQKLVHDRLLTTAYDDFVGLVAKSRRLSTEQVDKVAQGRVWTGEQAVEKKLVDNLGDLDDAIAEAKREASIGASVPIRVVELPEQPGLMEQLLGGKANPDKTRLGGGSARLVRSLMAGLRSELARRGAAGALYCSKIPLW